MRRNWPKWKATAMETKYRGFDLAVGSEVAPSDGRRVWVWGVFPKKERKRGEPRPTAAGLRRTLLAAQRAAERAVDELKEET